MKRSRGFTLIELLIVIAIILILIAIALPNFLEAQIRAQVTRVKGELRTVAIAIESYSTDYNSKFPHSPGKILLGASQHNRGGVHLLYNLTTPIEYVSSAVIALGDPFLSNYERDPITGNLLEGPDQHHYSYGYVNIDLYREQARYVRKVRTHYVVFSLGPDAIKGPHPITGRSWLNSQYGDDAPPPYFDPTFEAWQYSPTNGSKSKGDMLRFP